MFVHRDLLLRNSQGDQMSFWKNAQNVGLHSIQVLNIVFSWKFEKAWQSRLPSKGIKTKINNCLIGFQRIIKNDKTFQESFLKVRLQVKFNVHRIRMGITSRKNVCMFVAVITSALRTEYRGFVSQIVFI
jgi:hypothetical protein